MIVNLFYKRKLSGNIQTVEIPGQFLVYHCTKASLFSHDLPGPNILFYTGGAN